MIRRGYLFVFFCVFLVSCVSATESLPVSSIRFTPLNFPYSNLGEFTLSDAQHHKQLQLFLAVFNDTFSHGRIDDEADLPGLPHTFSLQLFSGTVLTAIYRLSFDFEQDIAFLQNERHIYAVAPEDFHQIIETGYFNMIFRKNHAPTAEFYLNSKDIKYSVSGTWNYETYQNNFLSYQINSQKEQATNYIVTGADFHLTYVFAEKPPDHVYETIWSDGQTVKNHTRLSTNSLEIPVQEGDYTYEIEAVWSDPELPYNAVLKYVFQIEVNYPPKVKLDLTATAGFLTAVTVENYDPGGRISVSSPLWENEISLTLINGKYYGLLPIPLNTAAGAYELLIAGSNSSETLQYKESLTVSAPAAGIAAVSAKNAALLSKKAAADPYYLAIAQTNAGTSQGEKLWHGNFTYPAAIAVTYIYGQKLAYRDFSYQPFCQIYAFTGDAEIFAAASGIVRLAEQTPDLGGTVVIDHGLGVFSVYSELSELSVSAGGYIFARQKLGQCAKTETVPTPAFTYGVIVNGYYVNPRAFFEHDPISFYR